MLRRIVVLASLAVLAACGDGIPKPASTAPLSADEAAELAKKFEAAIEPCDADQLNALFDTEQVLLQIVAQSKAKPAEKRGGLAALRARGDFLGRQLCAGFTEETRFDLLSAREIGGRRRPLFRATGASGVNYYEVIAGKTKDGAVRVTDLYVYLSGSTLTQTVAETIDQGLRAARGGSFPSVDGLTAAKQRGDHAELRRLIADLPSELRDGKALRIADLQAAIALDAPDYVDTIDRYMAAFPDDPSSDFISIDAYFIRKQLAPLLEAIDRVDRRVGRDPYLDYLRAGAYLMDPTPEHLAEAERLARSATAGVPDHPDVWWNLATVQITRKDHAGLVPTLDKLATTFAITFDRDAMTTDPLWQDFVASPEFATWWARRGQ
jgi:hypothetical protein